MEKIKSVYQLKVGAKITYEHMESLYYFIVKYIDMLDREITDSFYFEVDKYDFKGNLIEKDLPTIFDDNWYIVS